VGTPGEVNFMAILILLLLIGLNGLLAMAEIAVVSSRKIRLEQRSQRGNRGAAAALLLVESPTRFLSTVQVGITLIGIIAGAFGERVIAGDLAAVLGRNETLAPYAGIIATILVVLIITYLSLVVGELAPKRFAMNNPERVAALVARPMQVLSIITAPIVHFLSFSTDLLLRLFPSKGAEDRAATQEEIRGMIRQGAATGVFLEKERELVERIFTLADQRVAALMVPRTDIAWLSADATPERVRVAVATSSYSHFPVCEGGLDHLIGVVHLKDMIKSGLLTQSVNLRILARKPLFVPESMPALRLLEEFRRSRLHIAFVLDEYGVITGLITLNDIVESMLGQMTRLGEESEPLAIRRADGSWLLDGGMPLEDFKRLLDVEKLPHEDRTSFQTVAGFIMTYLGRIPKTGEHFSYHKYDFEIVDMDRHRIDKVIMTSQGAAAS
jgi:putative hemolysin